MGDIAILFFSVTFPIVSGEKSFDIVMTNIFYISFEKH